MRFVTLDRGGRDGVLGVVDRGHSRWLGAPSGLHTLQLALEGWAEAEPTLSAFAARVEAGDGEPLDLREALSPLPRSHQWADASSFLTHMERMRRARGAPMPPAHEMDPIVHQSVSSSFLRPIGSIPLRDEGWGLDLEATIAVVTDDLPIGADRATAARHVRLVLLANDLTHRNLLPAEFAKGVGFWHTKPARPFAPVAVTPDELGPLWHDGLLHATVCCSINDELLGELDSAADCAFDLLTILAYLARSRELPAGTIVGSGTVSNRDVARGFGCLAECRAVEMLDGADEPSTRYLRAGDRIRIEAFGPQGASLFGAMEHMVEMA